MGCSNAIYKSSRLTKRAIKFSASYLAMTSAFGRESRVSPVHTAIRNCTRDEGGPFEVSAIRC